MGQNWNNIKWIFEPDGSLLDIYIQDVTISDWIKLIDYLNENYQLEYGPTSETEDSKRIDTEYVSKLLQDESSEMELRSASIDLDGIIVNCHFFLPDQIEFDLLPNEISSINDYNKVERFMKSISTILKKQVTLTAENCPERPLIKIDMTNNLIRILTENEANKMFSKGNWLINKFRYIRTKIMLKFFREKINKKLLQSACEPYKSTKKSKNVW